METKHIIKLTSGKEIELTEQEYNELKSGFESETIKFIPYVPNPWHGYPNYPSDTWYKYYTTIMDPHIQTNI